MTEILYIYVMGGMLFVWFSLEILAMLARAERVSVYKVYNDALGNTHSNTKFLESIGNFFVLIGAFWFLIIIALLVGLIIALCAKK